MSYQVAVASSGGDDATMAKSFIITLEGPALTWYTRLSPLSIDSWRSLRDKFVLNFQGYRPDTDALAELSLCKQLERETLREYYHKFLTLKSQLPSVDDQIAIHYAISGLRAGVLYSHCIRDSPRNLQELYQLFEKYARSEELHQRKVESQRKPKDPPQSSRTWTRPSQADSGRDGRSQQQVYNIANQHPAGEAPRRQEYPPQGRGNGIRGRGWGRAQQPRKFYCLFHGEACAHPTRDCRDEGHQRQDGTSATSRQPQSCRAHVSTTPSTIQPRPRSASTSPRIPTPPGGTNRTSPTTTSTPAIAKHPPLLAPKQEDFANQPYRGVIHMITGGSSADFDTKRQKRDHYRSINHVAVTGPVVQTKWSHVPLTFDARDVDLRSAPHIDAMVINCSVAG
jgi:hypothetical protein